MKNRASALLLAALLAAVLVTGCGTSTTALQRLDPETGATVTRAQEPVVFYRDQSSRAAYARAYIYLAPIQVNTMGERRYYLWFGIWDTTESRPEVLDDFENVVIYADGEPLQLDVHGWSHSAIGASAPIYAKPTGSATDAYYEVTVTQLRLLAQATDLEIRAGGSRPAVYQPWDTSPGAGGSIRRMLMQVD